MGVEKMKESNKQENLIALIASVVAVIAIFILIFVLSFANSKRLSSYVKVTASEIVDVEIKDTDYEIHLDSSKYESFVKELYNTNVQQYIFIPRVNESTYCVNIQLTDGGYILNEGYVYENDKKLQLCFRDNELQELVAKFR